VKLSDDEIEPLFTTQRKFVELYFTRSAILWAFCRIESPIQVPQTQSAFHPHAQRNAFRRRGARLQSRSFARWNQSPIRNPNSNRLCALLLRAPVRPRLWYERAEFFLLFLLWY
jgi:hypothetical protein